MPRLIETPTVVQAAGTPPKRIEEFAGRVNSGHASVSVARMKSPAGWREPGQRPDFEEITVVLSGTVRVEHAGGTLDVKAGQAVIASPGEWIRYSTPDGPAEYVAVCLPAFSMESVHRDEVAIKDLPEIRVAAVSHVGPYNRIGEAFGKLGALAGPAGLFQQPDAAMIGIYYDDPETTPAEQLRSDAGIRVGATVALPVALQERRLAAGRYACAVHVGSYEQLGDAWGRLLREWLPQSGHRIRPGASFELYLNDPTKVPTHELRTEIYQPVE